jgi:type I restriction enzyme S subunit
MTDKQTVKFGDICKEVKLTTKDPIGGGYDRYIGLEHLDSGSLKIKRWGIIADDNPSFTRVFKKGHVLFGKRRPYLKKAAIAEFDGICSSDIIVMEASGDKLIEGLLPHLVQSEKMWAKASLTSSGSLSPRTKFKSLIDSEFQLPNLDGQNSLLAIFNKIEESNDCSTYVADNAERLEDLILLDTVRSLPPGETKKAKLFDICQQVTVGIVNKPADLYCETGIPALRSQNVKRGRISLDNLVYITQEGHEANKKSQVHPGDVVVVRTGYPGTASVIPESLEVANCVDILIIRPNTALIIPEYLSAYINSPLGKSQVLEGAGGLAQQHFNVKALKEMLIDLPSITMQKIIASSVNEVVKLASKNEENTAKRQKMVDALKSSI